MKIISKALNAFLISSALITTLSATSWPMGTGQESGELQIWGDYLYWRVTQDQIPVAAKIPGGIQPIIDQINSPPFDINPRFKVIEPRFRYSSGFRIGAAFNDLCSNWDVDLSWTRFHDKVTTQRVIPGGIFPLAIPEILIAEIITGIPEISVLADEFRTSWRFEYDAVDLKLGRNFQYFQCANTNPWVGVKAVRIKQRQRTTYFGLASDDIPISPFIYKKNELRAIGPSMGIDGLWEVLPGWNISSGLSGALVYGMFDVTLTPEIEFDGNSVQVRFQNNRRGRVRPMVDAFIGLDWDPNLCDTMIFNVGVGYEIQYWWNMWQVPTLGGGNAPQGDLMLSGLTVHASVIF